LPANENEVMYLKKMFLKAIFSTKHFLYTARPCTVHGYPIKISYLGTNVAIFLELSTSIRLFHPRVVSCAGMDKTNLKGTSQGCEYL
jgi:uncharacterized membrane protein